MEKKEYLYNNQVLFTQSSLAILLIFLVACAPDHQVQRSTQESIENPELQQKKRYAKADKPLFIGWQNRDRSTQDFSFQCKDCPSNTGQLVSLISEQTTQVISGSCQGTLISADLFLTNRHCLPKDLLEKQASCEDRIEIIFPGISDNDPAERIGCQQVVEFAPFFNNWSEDKPQPDWALLELKKKRPQRVLPTSKQGIKDLSVVYAFIPLQSEKHEKLQMTKITCISQQNTMALPEYNSDFSSLLYFQCDKDITKGFSGTTLFMEKNKKLIPVALLSHIWDQQINNEKIMVSNKIVATPFYCLPFEKDKPKTCDFQPSKRYGLKIQLLTKAIKNKEKNILETWKNYIADSNQPVEWRQILDQDVKTDEMAALYQNYWNKLKQQSQGSVEEESLQEFFKAIVGFEPVCIKQSWLEKNQDASQRVTEIPLIDLVVYENQGRRVRVEFDWQKIKTRILTDRDKEQNFVFSPLQEAQAYQGPRRALISGRLNHGAMSLPPCP